MKETDFRFEVRIASADAQAILDAVERKLLTLKGITSVSTTDGNGIFELRLKACFEDGEQAKKLHRKAMNALMALKEVTIVSTTTMLSDIF